MKNLKTNIEFAINAINELAMCEDEKFILDSSTLEMMNRQLAHERELQKHFRKIVISLGYIRTLCMKYGWRTSWKQARIVFHILRAVSKVWDITTINRVISNVALQFGTGYRDPVTGHVIKPVRMKEGRK